MMMKIELTSFTDNAAIQLIRAKNTRLGSAEALDNKIASMSKEDIAAELQYIANTIRSSWEFINYTFEISGISRACCDQMTRTRVGASFAVMTQRTVDLSNFNYVVPARIENGSPEVMLKFREHMHNTKECYQWLISKGVRPEDARAILPMATESPLSAQYNLRTLASLIAKRENLRAQGEYANVVSKMKELVLGVHPWAVHFLAPDKTATPYLNAILKEEYEAVQNIDWKRERLINALKELDKVKGVWE